MAAGIPVAADAARPAAPDVTSSPTHRIPLVVVMGVSGSGKTSVGAELAVRLGVPFADGDELHPSANVAKMSSGMPLTDDDRWPWLRIVGRTLGAARRRGVVVACSSLKRSYRDVITECAPSVIFVHLDGPRQLLLERLRARQGHFMPVELLDSQIADLEHLDVGERHVVIDVTPPLRQVVDDAAAAVRALLAGD